MRALIFILLVGVFMDASVLPKYYVKKLHNGLEVVAIPLHNGSNVISTNIFYKVGSKDEQMGNSGMAHMLEHLSFKSTKELKAGEFDVIVKNFGGVNNASTGFDYTHYFVNSSSANLGKVLKMFSYMMSDLLLKNSEFQTERDVVMQERLLRTDNSPFGFLYFNLFNNSFVYHPYHWTPIGFISDIKHWKIRDIKTFYKRYYQPQNAIIVVSGDFKKEELFKEANRYFGHKKNHTKEIHRYKYQVEPKFEGEKRILLKKESNVDLLAIAYHIPNFKDKDQVVLSVISDLLSSGKDSILYKDLVQKKRLVNQFSADNMEQKDPSLFIFLAVCNSGVDAKDVEKEINKAIEKLKTKEVSSKELDKIKLNTKTDFVYSLEKSSSVASLFGDYLAKGDIHPLLNYEKDLAKVTPKDVKRVANKYFKNKITVIIKRDEK